MKLVVYIFLVFTFSVSAQDTLQLSEKVLSSFNEIQAPRTHIDSVQQAIAIAEQLYPLKADKTKLSLVMALMYYKLGSEYTTTNTGTSGFAFTGYLPEPEQKAALEKAIVHFNYVIAHYNEKDDLYRNAQTGSMAVAELLTKFEK